MWTGTPVKANTLDRAGDGQTSAPDFCIFASPLVLLPVFLRRTHKGKHACKNEHPERRRRRTAFRSRFLYFCIVPSSPVGGFFCEEHMLAGRPQKANTPGGAGSCSPHFSDSRIVLRSRRPGRLLRAVRVRQPDLDSGGHFRRDGLSPGSSPSGRGGSILPGQLQSGGISV